MRSLPSKSALWSFKSVSFQYYEDSLLACLAASCASSSSSSSSSDDHDSTTKLVATNLIAEGRLWEGVQLLCLVGRAADACKYLQSCGRWDESLWLAKCRLEGDELAAAARYLYFPY